MMSSSSALRLSQVVCPFLCSCLKLLRSAALQSQLEHGRPSSQHSLLYKLLTSQAVKSPKVNFCQLTLTIMPPFVDPWDPKEVLEIGQEIAGIKCVAYAKTKGRQCRNPIARANYQQASEILLQISRMSISAPGVDDALAPLARLLICHHWDHQDQVEAVVAEWRDRIQQLQFVAAAHLGNGAQIEHHVARQEREIAGRERATARREITIARRERDVACRERDVARREIEKLRRDVAIARQETGTARRDAGMAHQETEIARRYAAISRQAAHKLRLEAARNLEARNALARQIVALSAAVRPRPATPAQTVEASRPNLAPSSTRHPERPPIGRDAAPISPEALSRAARRPTTIPSPSNQNSMPTEEDSSLLSIGGDCSICLHDLGHEGIVRCAAQCHQPFHGECINAWLEVRRICPLW